MTRRFLICLIALAFAAPAFAQANSQIPVDSKVTVGTLPNDARIRCSLYSGSVDENKVKFPREFFEASFHIVWGQWPAGIRKQSTRGNEPEICILNLLSVIADGCILPECLKETARVCNAE